MISFGKDNISLYIISNDRVHEDYPLYGILNQFQKGHSHMAVVVKCKKDVKSTVIGAAGKPTTLDIVTNSNSKLTQEDRKGKNTLRVNFSDKV